MISIGFNWTWTNFAFGIAYFPEYGKCIVLQIGFLNILFDKE